MSALEVENYRAQRAGLYEGMKTMLTEAEGRDFTAEEDQEYERREQEFDSLTKKIERIERLEGHAPTRSVVNPDVEARETGSDEDDDDDEGGEVTSLAEWRKRREKRYVDTREYRSAFYKWFTTPDGRQVTSEEHRVLSKASAGAGLNLVPTDFQNVLLDALREFGVMRQLATVFTTDAGEAITMPSVTTHGTAAWIAENAAYTPSDEVFGTATMNAYKAGTLIKVSEELLVDSAFDLETYIRNEFGIRIGILENTAYLVGDGSGKPTGVATQASAGVTAASATAITAGELIDLYHSLLSPYRNRASWLFKDSTVKLIRKLVDSTGQFLWQPGLQAGQPDVLLGRPVYVDPDMAAATAGLVSVLFGDFSWYRIRDVNGIAFQRLNELYAENGQVGFRAYHRTDGKLLNTAAVKKLTQL